MENKRPKILLLNLLKSLIALKPLNQGFQGKKGILRCFKQIFKAFDVLLICIKCVTDNNDYVAGPPAHPSTGNLSNAFVPAVETSSFE